jgi:hypothetical protein
MNTRDWEADPGSRQGGRGPEFSTEGYLATSLTF